MPTYEKLTWKDCETILKLIDEIEPAERTMSEKLLREKIERIRLLQKQAAERIKNNDAVRATTSKQHE